MDFDAAETWSTARTARHVRPASRSEYRQPAFDRTALNAVRLDEIRIFGSNMLQQNSTMSTLTCSNIIFQRDMRTAAWPSQGRKTTSGFFAAVGAKRLLWNSESVIAWPPSPLSIAWKTRFPLSIRFLTQPCRNDEASAYFPYYGKFARPKNRVFPAFTWDIGSKAAEKCRIKISIDRSKLLSITDGVRTKRRRKSSNKVVPFDGYIVRTKNVQPTCNFLRN